MENSLRTLQREYEFIPLREAVEMLAGKCEPRPRCMVLTFDDGYLNNFSLALPVLEKLGIPATFFVCPGMMDGRRRYWIDRIDYAIQHLPPSVRTVEVGHRSVALDFGSRQRLADSYKRLRLEMKAAFTEDFDAQVDELAAGLEAVAGRSLSEIEPDDTWAAIMSWPQASESHRRRGFIGSHTTDHVRLTLVDRATARQQLRKSLEILRESIGEDTDTLAYPNGDHSEAIGTLAAESGYCCGLTSTPGINEPGDDLFALRRINLPSEGPPEKIIGIASGFRHALSRAGRKPGIG